jgi:FkbM family methyltransferase
MAKADRKIILETGPNILMRCRYGYMVFNRLDEYIGRSLEHYGEYNGAEGNFLCAMLSPGQTVVEVGANIGTHTIALGQAVGATGQVIAFEPQAGAFQLLCANVALNNLSQVKTLAIAVGAKSGHIKMPRMDYTKPGNFGAVTATDLSTAPSAAPHRDGDIVPLGRLDDMLRLKNCRLLKVDAEGMELETLQGAETLIKQHQPILYVENDRKDKSPALISFILGLGYSLYWHTPLLFHADNFFENDAYIFARERIASINMVAAPPGTVVANMKGREITRPDDWWRDRLGK